MNSAMTNTARRWLVPALAVAALLVLGAIFYSPIWWVALKAPNYPPEAFPDGVRIQFHMNGVFNGCKKVEKREVQEDEALDCVHEMDTINHYVGMYPIAAGGPVEKGYAQFLVILLAIMVVGFAIPGSKARTMVMGVGFLALVGWMSATIYGSGGIKWENMGYVSALISSLDQGKGEGDEGTSGQMSPGQAVIEQLRRSLAESGIETKNTEEERPRSEKEKYIDSLRVTFEKDTQRRGIENTWNGSGLQVMSWHYEKSLGRYFNNPAEILPMVAKLRIAIHVVFVGIIAAMAVLLLLGRKTGGPIYWLMILVPMALPVFFVIEYSAWLWWFGHSLNEMGAFTVKPFMPTVFGEGKVAQFTTYSYPYYGFALMLLFALIAAAMALVRHKELKR